MKDKVMILRSDQEFEVNILKLKLEDAGIPCWVINKHDSISNNFGDLELYVDISNAEIAKKIITPEQKKD